MACFYPEVYDLRPWLHDFTKLGLQTYFGTHPTGWLRQFLALIHPHITGSSHSPLRAVLHPVESTISVNQQRIETGILTYIQHCLLEMPGNMPLGCIDLFCTDGYFTCMLSNMRMNTLNIGLDPDEGNIRRAKVAAKLLNLKQTHFIQADAADFVRTAQAYDLILCIGGLTYQPTPLDFLRQLRKTGSQYLVLQSDVVSGPHFHDDHIKESRPEVCQQRYFTHMDLGHWLRQAGWQILESAIDEPGSRNGFYDMNSGYYRCKAAV